MARDADYVRLIHTGRWLRLRRDQLSRNPLCERCAEEGRITPASEVHHVVPVEEGLTATEKETLMFSPSNLASLCHDCHVRTHTEMGRSGKKAAKQRTERMLERFKKKFME